MAERQNCDELHQLQHAEAEQEIIQKTSVLHHGKRKRQHQQNAQFNGIPTQGERRIYQAGRKFGKHQKKQNDKRGKNGARGIKQTVNHILSHTKDLFPDGGDQSFFLLDGNVPNGIVVNVIRRIFPFGDFLLFHGSILHQNL